MTVSKAYGVYGVLFDTDALGGVTSCGVPTNTVTEETPTDGNIYARFQSMMSQSPQPTFTTHAIGDAITLCGVSGLDISTLTAGLSLFAQKRAQGGTRAGATSHIKYNMADGIVYPTNVTAAQDSSASISYAAMTISDDSVNAPMTITDSQSLTATTDTERFGIGTVSIGGTTITGVTGIDIDFGINVRLTSADGNVFPTFASIDDIQPMVTIRTLDGSVGVDSTGAVDLEGVLGTHANTIIYLRKRDLGGKYILDATAEHMKFTCYGMATLDDAFSASANDTGETAITIRPIYDGSNAPITAALSAIT